VRVAPRRTGGAPPRRDHTGAVAGHRDGSHQEVPTVGGGAGGTAGRPGIPKFGTFGPDPGAPSGFYWGEAGNS